MLGRIFLRSASGRFAPQVAHGNHSNPEGTTSMTRADCIGPAPCRTYFLGAIDKSSIKNRFNSLAGSQVLRICNAPLTILLYGVYSVE